MSLMAGKGHKVSRDADSLIGKQKPRERLFLLLSRLYDSFFSYTGNMLNTVELRSVRVRRYEPPHDKNQQNNCAPYKDSDQPGHPCFCENNPFGCVL